MVMISKETYIELEEGDDFARDKQGNLIFRYSRDETVHKDLWLKYVSIEKNISEHGRFEVMGPTPIQDRDSDLDWKVYHKKDNFISSSS